MKQLYYISGRCARQVKVRAKPGDKSERIGQKAQGLVAAFGIFLALLFNRTRGHLVSTMLAHFSFNMSLL
jgi:hypothetical protein